MGWTTHGVPDINPPAINMKELVEQHSQTVDVRELLDVLQSYSDQIHDEFGSDHPRVLEINDVLSKHGRSEWWKK